MTDRDSNAPSGTLPSAAAPGTPVSPPGASPVLAEPSGTLGLRLRVWVACLAGALVSVLALWWVAGTQLTVGADPVQLLAWLAGTGAVGVVIAIAAALWLDRGIVVHLRGLTRGFASGRVQELRGLPAASGWGELSELTEWAAVMITRQRVSQRATSELEQLEATLARALERLESWRSTERWEPLHAEPGPGAAVVKELNETFSRAVEIDEQNFEAARRIRGELMAAAGDARDSAAMAERGFVEATSLLTTVHELHRLGQELRLALTTARVEVVAPPEPPLAVAAPPAAAAASAAALAASEERIVRYRESVESAIEELVTSSNESIEHLGAALRRVQEIAHQVQIVSQRATLVALHAVTLESRLPRDERRGDDLSRELRLLTGEVRAAAQHADALAADVEHETRAADERMKTVRERVAPKLEPPAEVEEFIVDSEGAVAAEAGGSLLVAGHPAQPGPMGDSPPALATASAPLSDHTLRLLERVREMIQDATQKGERLSAAGERASRAAERLLRRLDEETREVEGLMVRLSPSGEVDTGLEDALDSLEPHPAPADLRLLDPEDASPEEGVTPAGENDDDANGFTFNAREERP